uniref:Solute-binding protein family 3/N-terminal domain-containing protein n=1 Tax=Rhodococcus sp. NS1 TaxID=402236 RepID=A0A097SQJ5_9NOCA|nr:hypothetical protein LRS1606.374 [Rhodococcus sp. NS1]
MLDERPGDPFEREQMTSRTLLVWLIAMTTVTMTATACGSSERSGPGTCTDIPAASVHSDVDVTGSPVFDRMVAKGHVTVGVKVDQPGLGYKDVNGNRCGFDIEIARLISAGLGFDPSTISFKEIPSANREVSIQAGEVDYYVGTYTINDARLKQIDFAGPYIVAGQSLLVRADEDTITGQSALAGKRVCSAVGTTSIQRIKDKGLTEPKNIVEFKTALECVSQMLDGNVDAVTTDDAILKGYSTAIPDEVKLVGEPFSTEPYGIGLAREPEPALCDAMNEILQTAINDGTWNAIYDATLGKSGVPADPPELRQC